jgi:hypothetical protein
VVTQLFNEAKVDEQVGMLVPEGVITSRGAEKAVRLASTSAKKTIDL